MLPRSIVPAVLALAALWLAALFIRLALASHGPDLAIAAILFVMTAAIVVVLAIAAAPKGR